MLLKSDLCICSLIPPPLSPADESGRLGVELGRVPLALGGLRIDALELGLFGVAIVLVVAVLAIGTVLVADALELGRLEVAIALELGLLGVAIALVVAVLAIGIVLVDSFVLTLRLLVLLVFPVIFRGGGSGGGCGLCTTGRV